MLSLPLIVVASRRFSQRMRIPSTCTTGRPPAHHTKNDLYSCRSLYKMSVFSLEVMSPTCGRNRQISASTRSSF